MNDSPGRPHLPGAEFGVPRGRRILADQMEFLLAHFPRSSPLHRRVKQLLVA